ncbi:GGDEF domain-containing protein [Undibacterium fentianense]|uniref:Diguanylate cyclase n=1 Tax=Undibacterium fentianense TaxID=2828728 RepID=A0A941IDP9_9BURK|nr:diguanylate cyclase [Undibacterium fentianense]MBR7798617.1 diguanylate cyclase [Undibacterium fentianense]
MATPLEGASRMDLFSDGSVSVRVDTEKFEAKIARFERLGVRLFDVANCIVSFGNLRERFDRSEQSMVVMEAGFCESLGFSDEIRVFTNLNFENDLATHPSVKGEPHIVFCAQHPIFDSANQCIGNIYLIDYLERDFDDVSRLLLADLAVMVEREIVMNAIKAQYSELVRQVRNLKRDALLDPVLGMWNRAAIARSLGLELERCHKAEKPLSLLYISINQYQVIKERFGGSVGDAFLLKVASRMRSCIRPFDALGRFESDAFLIVLPGASNLVASAVAERIRLAIVSRSETVEQDTLEISISVGIASSSVFPNVVPEALVAHAEKALLTARKLNGNHIVQAKPEQPDISL